MYPVRSAIGCVQSSSGIELIGIWGELPVFSWIRPARSYSVARSLLWRTTPPHASSKLLVPSTERSYTNGSDGSTISISATSAANESLSIIDFDRMEVERKTFQGFLPFHLFT